MIISTLCFLGILAIPFAIAAVLYFKEMGFRQKAEKVTGTVTQLAIQTDSSGGWKSRRSYCPVIEFKTKEGRTLSHTGKIGSNPPAYKVGQKVDLYYDPQDPKAVHMGRAWASVSMLVLAIIAGAILVFGLPIYIIVVIGGYAAQMIK